VDLRCAVNGVETGFYFSNGPVPPGYTKYTKNRGNESIDMVIKCKFELGDPSIKDPVQFSIHGDYRISGLVSLLKAGHLSIFHLLGYHYALSTAGRFMGDVIGNFYLQNKGRRLADVAEAAISYFRHYKTMMRPIAARASPGFPFSGSVDDGKLMLCISPTKQLFAIGTIIRTDDRLHMVLMPAFEMPDSVKLYLDFLENSDELFHRKIVQFDRKRKSFIGDQTPPELTLWPKHGPTFDL
jgi:hypothetical protein